MTTGDRLKQLRNEKGLSTYELSEKTGISQSTISKLENNKRRADLYTIEKIANALDVNVKSLFEDENKGKISALSNKLAVKNSEDVFWDIYENLPHRLKTKVIVLGITRLILNNFTAAEITKILSEK